MASSIVVHTDKHIFRTAYRPILTTAVDTIGDAAYLKAELERETWNNSGTWVGIGIYLNAYENFGGSQTYTFNSMGYCRELISGGVFSKYNNALTGDDIGTTFRLRVSAVRYSNTPNQPLIDDETDFAYSDIWYALPTTTNELQGLAVNNWPHTHHEIDRLVLGDNWGASDNSRNYRFSQNKATYKASTSYAANWRSSAATKAYTVNRADSRNDGIYVPVGLGSYWDEFWVFVAIMSKTGSVLGNHTFQVSKESYLHKIPCHPDPLKNYIMAHGGGAANTLVNGWGTLIAGGVTIFPFVKASSTSQVKIQRDDTSFPGSGNPTPTHVDYSEEENNGKCNRSKFVFRNTSGGYDWLNIYGTETKATSFESVLYDSIPTSGSSLHTRKTLYNNREDIFTVVSQPVDRKIGRHIEEMITSSLIWINLRLKNALNIPFNDSESRLVPIIIVPGSFDIYNTEDNISFIKFSYTFSEQITLQKG